jgi:hypothetical protein
MGAILSAIISGIVGAILGIFEKKTAKSNEYEARSLQAQKESVVIGKKLESEIDRATAEVPVPKTAQDLDRLLGLAPVLLFAFFLPGCFETKVTVNQYKPEIKTPKPKKVDGPDELTPREQALGQYAGQLRTAIGKYNAWAKKSNAQAGYPPNEATGDYEYIVTFENEKAAVVELPRTQPDPKPDVPAVKPD